MDINFFSQGTFKTNLTKTSTKDEKYQVLHTLAKACRPETTTCKEVMLSSSSSHDGASASGQGSIADNRSRCIRRLCKSCGSSVL